jgi:hypothetical protein
MIPPTKRSIILISAVFALVALCFNPQIFAPIARANQSPPLVITLNGSTECGIGATTSVVVSDYAINDGQFCFTIGNGGGRIVGISSPFVALGPVPPQGGTICGHVLAAVTPQEAAQSLLVTYDFGYQPCAERISCENSSGKPRNIALLEIIVFQDEFWFTILNSSESRSAITRVGFDLESTGPFTLNSIIPTPQPGDQDLIFTTESEKIPKFKNAELSFAVKTGNVFGVGNPLIGIQPGETSSQFRVSGNFSGLIGITIPDGAYVRFTGNEDVQCTYQCDDCSGGLSGIISGSPR